MSTTQTDSTESGATEPVSTHDGFVTRHIGPSPSQIEVMLAAIGVSSLDELIDQALPASIRRPDRSSSLGR